MPASVPEKSANSHLQAGQSFALLFTFIPHSEHFFACDMFDPQTINAIPINNPTNNVIGLVIRNTKPMIPTTQPAATLSPGNFVPVLFWLIKV